MDKFFLVPNKEGLNVRDPLTGKPLPKEGAWKPKTNYWLRRLVHQEVAVGEPPAATKEQAAAPETEQPAQQDSAASSKGKAQAKSGAVAQTSTDSKGDAQ